MYMTKHNSAFYRFNELFPGFLTQDYHPYDLVVVDEAL